MFYAVGTDNMVYGFSRTQYKKVLRAIVNGETYTLGSFGIRLGYLIITTITTLSKEQAEDLIRKLGKSP